MEGYREYYWKGDEIVWKNLFKHYILCLEYTSTMCRLFNDEDKELYQNIPIYRTIDDLPTDLYKDRVERINKLFFKDEFVQFFIKIVFNNPFKIYKEDLNRYLNILHGKAVESIIKIDIQDGMINVKEPIVRQLNRINYKDINFKTSDFKEFFNKKMRVLIELFP